MLTASALLLVLAACSSGTEALPTDASVGADSTPSHDGDETTSLRDRGGVKLLPPPGGGVYLGQTEISAGNRSTFESAIGKAVAIWAWADVMAGTEEADAGALAFDPVKAQDAWDKGYVVVVSAYEPYPGHGGFTVDKLIRGDYDADLTQLATQFKQFGQPMIFATAREPNGILADYFGGFGPDGNQRGRDVSDQLGQFTPPPGPPGNPDLFAGLGQPDGCDGLERLAAAQRYYHDFFTRREGIDFLTFETMGWVAGVAGEDEPCGYHWPAFYHMLEGYADWVSINWYPVLEAGHVNLQPLAAMMDQIRREAPGMPVMITELGFCGDRPEKITEGLASIVDHHPEIGAIILWGDSSDISGDYKCLVTAGPEADAFRAVMDARPGKFHSCAAFSDGSSPPDCESYDRADPAKDDGSCLTDCLSNGEPADECQQFCGGSSDPG